MQPRAQEDEGADEIEAEMVDDMDIEDQGDLSGDESHSDAASAKDEEDAFETTWTLSEFD